MTLIKKEHFNLICMSFICNLTIAFIVLKLAKFITWSWLWVWSPIWLYITPNVVLFLILLILGYIKMNLEKKRAKESEHKSALKDVEAFSTTRGNKISSN